MSSSCGDELSFSDFVLALLTAKLFAIWFREFLSCFFGSVVGLFSSNFALARSTIEFVVRGELSGELVKSAVE